MGSIKKAYFDAPDGQLHYRTLLTTQSPKKSPCIFLHMSANSSLHFESLMKLYAARGHDCYAPDMPGFGNSYDPETQPPGTIYYVDVFMQLFKSLGLSKFHLLGHHSGAGIATELAAIYPDFVLSLCLVGAAIMPRQEQLDLKAAINVPLNDPVASGAHLQATWDYLNRHGVGEDLEFRQKEVLDHIRAWKGRRQIYACVFEQDMWGFFEKVGCETMVMCARDDVLWPCVKYVKQIKPDVRFEEVKGGDFETGRPDSVKQVGDFHFDFLEKIGA